MIRQRIYLPNWNWVCKVYYEAEPINYYEIVQELDIIGANKETISAATANLTSGRLNTGLTYSNFKDGISLVVISKTTSASEFFDTFIHEIGHVVMHISHALKIDIFGEEYQYLNGTLSKRMFAIAKHLMCDECRHAKKENSNLNSCASHCGKT